MKTISMTLVTMVLALSTVAQASGDRPVVRVKSAKAYPAAFSVSSLLEDGTLEMKFKDASIVDANGNMIEIAGQFVHRADSKTMAQIKKVSAKLKNALVRESRSGVCTGGTVISYIVFNGTEENTVAVKKCGEWELPAEAADRKAARELIRLYQQADRQARGQ